MYVIQLSKLLHPSASFVREKVGGAANLSWVRYKSVRKAAVQYLKLPIFI